MSEISVCPECDVPNIQPRRCPGTRSRVADREGTRWRCRDCDAEFDDPERRQKKRDPPLNGLAGELARMGEEGSA